MPGDAEHPAPPRRLRNYMPDLLGRRPLTKILTAPLLVPDVLMGLVAYVWSTGRRLLRSRSAKT